MTRARTEEWTEEVTGGASPEAQHWIAEATRVCRAAAQGDLEARILRIDNESELADLLHSVNRLLDMTDAFVRESTAALEYASEERFFRRVLPEGMLGSFAKAAGSINGATRQMHQKTQDLEHAEARRHQLAQDFNETMREVTSLAEASHHIEGFSKVIKTIAHQTNMLSLNAAIEAARVGEAGRGFAVVADEVKRLSEQASEATRQIEGQLESIKRATNETMRSIHQVRDVLAQQDSGQDNG